MPERMIRRLDRDTLRSVYRDHVRRDFPPAERKPLHAIERMVDAGEYDVLGLCEDASLLAYAFVWRDREGACVLLDYLAVCQGGRGKGVGSAFLGALEDYYRDFPGILVEAEAPEPEAGEEENALRVRRLEFYRRAGFRRLDYQVRLFGVHYVCLASGTLDSAAALAAHRRHYRWTDRLPGKLAQIPYSSGSASSS